MRGINRLSLFCPYVLYLQETRLCSCSHQLSDVGKSTWELSLEGQIFRKTEVMGSFTNGKVFVKLEPST